MSDADIDRIERMLGPLLRALDGLAFVARHVHPPDLPQLAAATAPLGERLADAIATPHAWSDRMAGLGRQLDLSAQEALAGFEGLAAAADDGNPALAGFRALRHGPRALEALYPLAGILPPVSRFFLDDADRSDDALAARFLAPAPDGTGVFCLSDEPDARGSVWVYVPETYSAEAPTPLVMALHGGGGRGRGFLWSWLRQARSRGAILIAPTSLGDTWAITGDDVDSPNLAALLAFAQANWAIDPDRLLLTGMSDGGTFTYVSGLQAESPFTHLAPVSAAFLPLLMEVADAGRLRGLPIHITHGSHDWMFPPQLARTAQRVLAAGGASITYREIEDLSHTYPTEINTVLLDWMASG